MIKNYFKIAIRSLLRRKGYTVINIFGLAIGIACCLLVYIYIQHELSYDKYHEKSERTYRILHNYFSGKAKANFADASPEDYQVWGSAPAGPALKAEFPEIETYTRFTSPLTLVFANGEKKFQEKEVIFMDSTAFDIFSWKVLAGNPKNALVEPGSLVLTESIARKYFGTIDVVGNTLRIENKEDGIITAVIEDIPHNSQFDFDILIPMASFYESRPGLFDNWGYVDFYTYFLLAPKAEIDHLQSKIPELLARNIPEDMRYHITFEPMEGAYLNSQAKRQPGPTGNMNNIYIFSSIGLFILIIACINFMNLATARSLERAKEVGVRKSIGAVRSGLIKQFLAESLLVAVVATFIALVFVEFALPLVRAISGKELLYENIRLNILLISSMIALVVGILAGSYPALVLSGFKPANVLKGSFGHSSQGNVLRKSLVVFQFSLSIILITGTIIVFSQLDHLRSKDLGFDREQMLVIDFGYNDDVQENIDLIRNAFNNHPEVSSVATSRAVPGKDLPGAYTRIEGPDGETTHRNPLIYEVDPTFFSHFGIEFLYGRPFSTDIYSDTLEALIVNEAAAQEYGYINAENIIGKKFEQWGREGVVVGVTKNFNFQSLHTEVKPLSMRFATPGNTSIFTLKVESNNYNKTISELEDLWVLHAPNVPFMYEFLDQELNAQYANEERFGNLFTLFAGLAIFIACLGLLGLSTYTTEQRSKEIGIRKILGASVYSIVQLLSKDFIKLVVIALIIAVPVSWYVMELWLNEFIYRTTISPWFFVIAGLATVIITLLTVSGQSLKSAISNPIQSLRNE